MNPPVEAGWNEDAAGDTDGEAESLLSNSVQHSNPSTAAHAYATQGIRVFPLHTPRSPASCSCGDPACSRIGKHPRTPRGFHDATTDPAIIDDWWARWPAANVGLRTGDGLVVVDVDPGQGGDDSWAHILKTHGAELHCTYRVATGGRGTHLYYRSDPDVPIPCSAGRVARGIDIRGDGGYVVAPPSLHRSGRRYRCDSSLAEDIAPFPPPLRAMIRTTARPDTAHIRGEAFLHRGERNTRLFRLGCHLRRAGLTTDEMAAALDVVNASRCVPPLAARELASIVHSASRYAVGQDGPGPRPRMRVITIESRHD